jgi:hypothetical protein
MSSNALHKALPKDFMWGFATGSYLPSPHDQFFMFSQRVFKSKAPLTWTVAANQFGTTFHVLQAKHWTAGMVMLPRTPTDYGSKM